MIGNAHAPNPGETCQIEGKLAGLRRHLKDARGVIRYGWVVGLLALIVFAVIPYFFGQESPPESEIALEPLGLTQAGGIRRRISRNINPADPAAEKTSTPSDQSFNPVRTSSLPAVAGGSQGNGGVTAQAAENAVDQADGDASPVRIGRLQIWFTATPDMGRTTLLAATAVPGRAGASAKAGPFAHAEPILQGVPAQTFKGASIDDYTLFVRVPANIYESPEKQSRVKFNVAQGEPVAVTERQGRWVNVRLGDGRYGWGHASLFSSENQEDTSDGPIPGELRSVQTESASARRTRVVFGLNGYYPPETVVIEGDKPRVVCDFLNTRLGGNVQPQIEVNDGVVVAIRIGVHRRPQPKVRVVLDLIPMQNYLVEQQFLREQNTYALLVKRQL
jgi:hypothetical protein